MNGFQNGNCVISPFHVELSSYLKPVGAHFDKSISLKKGQVSEVSAAAGGRLLSPQCHAVRATGTKRGTPPVLNLGGGFIFF